MSEEFTRKDAHLVLQADNLRRQLRVEILSPLPLDPDLLADEQHEQPSPERLSDGARAGRHHFLKCRHHEANGPLRGSRAARAEDTGGFVTGAQIFGELLVEPLFAQGGLEASA